MEASITDASYALLKDDDADVSEDGEKDLLAVDLKIKNVSSDTVHISPYSNIKLYDGNEEVNIEDDIYSTRLDMGTSRGGSIGAGNTKKMTVLVKVKKGKTYTLGIQPFTEKSGDDSDELKLALDTKKYSKSYDSMQDPAKALKAYIDTIYLNKDNADYEKYVSENKEAVQTEAYKTFKKAFNDNITDDISDADMKKYYEAYKSAAAEKAKLDAEAVASYKNKAVVKLTYSTISMDDISEKVEKYADEYLDNSENYDSEKAKKYALSKFDSIVSSMEPKEAEDPAEVSMVKKDGKWTVWQENDYTNELEEAFAGGEVY
ncbi:DUF5105 domain-containing protein [Heyndrickxia coagulans]|uniref:DUF5105 domain-containing protein n=1 Tax=Heyndrickxia coagulans TaxID=1398 RepID=UPI0034A091BB